MQFLLMQFIWCFIAEMIQMNPLLKFNSTVLHLAAMPTFDSECPLKITDSSLSAVSTLIHDKTFFIFAWCEKMKNT